MLTSFDPSGLFDTETLRYARARLSTLKQRVEKLKAWEIPALIYDAFLFEMTSEERKLFDSTRDLRNDIAHGRCLTADLNVAISISKGLHDLAKRIDQHLVRNFLIQEPR